MLAVDEYENPVGPEDITGIPKEINNGPNSDESSTPLGSVDISIPEYVKKEFQKFADRRVVLLDGNPRQIDPDHLFAADRFDHGDSISGARYFYRFNQRLLEDDQKIIDFEIQSSFWVNTSLDKPYSEFSLGRDQISPDLLKGSKSHQGFKMPTSEAVWLRRYRDDMRFFQIVRDEGLEVTYEQEELSEVTVNRATEIFRSDYKPEFRFHRSDLILTLKNGAEKLEHDGHTQSFGEVEELNFGGKKLQIVTTGDEVRLIFYRAEQQDKVDYEVTIPKTQEMVDFDTGERVERRYVWEEDLIPETLRKDPHQPPIRKVSGLPDIEVDAPWKRADLAKTLGIRIEKTALPSDLT
ncbi:MAG: hypothetical protein WD231_03330 [Candidatus Woykebacteria bacterium]